MFKSFDAVWTLYGAFGIQFSSKFYNFMIWQFQGHRKD